MAVLQQTLLAQTYWLEDRVSQSVDTKSQRAVMSVGQNTVS